MKRSCSGAGGGGSVPIPRLHIAQHVGRLGGGASRLGASPAQMPCLAEWRFFFGSEKGNVAIHRPPRETLCFIQVYNFYNLPLFHPAKDCSVIESMPSKPYCVSCSLTES